MRQKPSILILSAGYGEGHRQAATALSRAFQERPEPTRVHVVDYMEMVHPVLNSITRYLYQSCVKYAPNVYGVFYRLTDKIPPTSIVQQLVRQIGARKLLKYIRSTEPDVVINTFPLSSGAMAWLKRQALTDVMSATVITDYTVHSQWVHDQTDRYFVGSQHVKETLLEKGVPAGKIEVTGIPVRPCFHERHDRSHLKQTLGLDERPTLLVMGGWHGVFNASTCERLAEVGTTVQLLFVCGGDRQLFHRILPLQMKYPDRVRVFGYVSNIQELMAVSDCILTKAGGLTTSEALAMGVPMLLYRPIPGQEEANARFLIERGVACLARHPHQLIEKFTQLCRNSEQLALMKERANSVKPGNASEKIVDCVLAHTEGRKVVFAAVKS